MSVAAWLRRIVRRQDVSNAWLVEQERRDARVGWLGPRWRSPAEILDQQRVERRKRIALLRSERDEDRRRA